MKSWVGIGEGRARKSVCCAGMSVRLLVIHTLHNSSIRAQYLLKLQAGLAMEHFERYKNVISL